MSKNKVVICENQIPLPMRLPELLPNNEIEFRHLPKPLWTENKAKLIERYLLYFVYITKHGTYIDGFAGSQEPDKPEMWAAKLVLENEPRWMRHFYLYDIDKKKVDLLEALKTNQPERDSKNRKINRNITIQYGDFNVLIQNLLDSDSIGQKEATFCLLDQRTFECKWSTVEALANYKDEGFNKIEIFYFLPNSWLDRALAGLTINKKFALDCWGTDDFEKLKSMKSIERMEWMRKKFKDDLNYKYVTPWPIYEKENGRGAVMYYMMHATDHNDAPKLMERAYHNIVKPKETIQQLEFLFNDV